MASQRIPDETRESVAEAMRTREAGLPTVAQIARSHGISARSVQNIANAAGISNAAAQARTQNARDTLRTTNAQRRALLAGRLLDAAGAALDEIEQGESVIAGIAAGDIVSRKIRYLLAKDRQALMTAAAIALDKHKMLDAYDGASDNSDVVGWLEWMTRAARGS